MSHFLHESVVPEAVSFFFHDRGDHGMIWDLVENDSLVNHNYVLMGQLAINGSFSIAMLIYQRGCTFRMISSLSYFWGLASEIHTKHYGTSPVLMGKLTINGRFQELCSIPRGYYIDWYRWHRLYLESLFEVPSESFCISRGGRVRPGRICIERTRLKSRTFGYGTLGGTESYHLAI